MPRDRASPGRTEWSCAVSQVRAVRRSCAVGTDELDDAARVVDEVIGEGRDPVGSAAHLDLVLGGDGMRRHSGPAHPYGEGRVQVGGLEPIAHELFQLSDRRLVVNGFDGDEPVVDVGVGEAVQLVQEQFRLAAGGERVRVGQTVTCGGLAQQVADLEALCSADAVDELRAGALAAFAEPAEGDDPGEAGTRGDLRDHRFVRAVQLVARGGRETSGAGDHVCGKGVQRCVQVVPLPVQGRHPALGQVVPVRGLLAVPDAQGQYGQAVEDGGEGFRVQGYLGARGPGKRAQNLVGALCQGVAFGVELVDLPFEVRHTIGGQAGRPDTVLGPPQAGVDRVEAGEGVVEATRLLFGQVGGGAGEARR